MMALLLLYSKHGNNLRILSATIIPAALLGTLKSHTLSFYYHHKTKPHLFPLYFWKKCWELTTLTLLLENQTTNWWWPWVFDVLNWILVLLNLSWALRQQPQRMSASFKATTPPAPQQHNARCLPSLVFHSHNSAFAEQPCLLALFSDFSRFHLILPQGLPIRRNVLGVNLKPFVTWTRFKWQVKWKEMQPSGDSNEFSCSSPQVPQTPVPVRGWTTGAVTGCHLKWCL